MSGRKRASSDRTAALLDRLAVPTPDEEALDHVPEDFVLPSKSVDAIRAVLAFSGTVAASLLPTELRALTRSRRRDLIGLAWVLVALTPEGRAALLVPESILSEATQGHLQLRRTLVEQGRLHGVIGLAAGCCGRSRAAIVLLGRAETGDVWFCSVADPRELEPEPGTLEPDCVVRWRARGSSERERTRGQASFLVPRAEIAAAQFDLSSARYRATNSATSPPIPRPQEILAELAGLEAEIFQSLRDLVGMLKT